MLDCMMLVYYKTYYSTYLLKSVLDIYLYQKYILLCQGLQCFFYELPETNLDMQCAMYVCFFFFIIPANTLIYSLIGYR